MFVIVVDYDPAWPLLFAQLQARVQQAVAGLASAIEHVGSTSVPGLAAKPIIDMDIIAPTENEIVPIIERLAAIGYVHRGDLGVAGREAFRAPDDLPRHHLYLCVTGVGALQNHLAVRDYLRKHPDMALTYGNLKKQLAQDSEDINEYMRRKTDFILDILRRQNLSADIIEDAERINRRL